MAVKQVKLRRQTVVKSSFTVFFCPFAVVERVSPSSAAVDDEGENCGGKRIPGKEKQEKTRCVNERLRVTEDVDVYNEM